MPPLPYALLAYSAFLLPTAPMAAHRHYYLSQGVSVREHEGGFYVQTSTEDLKINQTIATFLGLLHEPKTTQQLVRELQGLLPEASTAVLRPLVAKFLKDLRGLEVVRQEGDVDIAPLTPLYQPGARVGAYLITDLLSLHSHTVQLYRATDAASGQRVVLKLFSPTPERVDSDAGLANALQQFQQEFDIMGSLPAHPGVCALLAYHAQPQPYAVLEYLPGESLSDCLRQDTIAEASKAPVATQMLQALAHLHAHGIVHGDIHARNFMVHAGHATLLDFGFSYRLGVSADEQLINGGGVPTYLAPERIRQHPYKFSKQAADLRAEVYQIALVLFRLYFKKLPFEGDTWRERAASIAAHDFGQHLSPAVPHEGVLLRALRKNPAERYAGAQELLAAWQQALAVESEAAPAIAR